MPQWNILYRRYMDIQYNQEIILGLENTLRQHSKGHHHLEDIQDFPQNAILPLPQKAILQLRHQMDMVEGIRLRHQLQGIRLHHQVIYILFLMAEILLDILLVSTTTRKTA